MDGKDYGVISAPSYDTAISKAMELLIYSYELTSEDIGEVDAIEVPEDVYLNWKASSDSIKNDEFNLKFPEIAEVVDANDYDDHYNYETEELLEFMVNKSGKLDSVFSSYIVQVISKQKSEQRLSFKKYKEAEKFTKVKSQSGEVSSVSIYGRKQGENSASLIATYVRGATTTDYSETIAKEQKVDKKADKLAKKAIENTAAEQEAPKEIEVTAKVEPEKVAEPVDSKPKVEPEKVAEPAAPKTPEVNSEAEPSKVPDVKSTEASTKRSAVATQTKARYKKTKEALVKALEAAGLPKAQIDKIVFVQNAKGNKSYSDAIKILSTLVDSK